jgi:hypothetical protein
MVSAQPNTIKLQEQTSYKAQIAMTRYIFYFARINIILKSVCTFSVKIMQRFRSVERVDDDA